ncbi:MAG: 7-carboxy-7-deazaguanine synthase QueE [Bryobacteraceae bacterium]|nr:7-carboxy-7-deazaguanine synthase QueE [Bryobacteraceae bacterium]
MRIAELFYSIQGEGALIGVPSVFVRTSGCNLRCWWCDTPYTSWAPEGADMSIAEVCAYARENSTGYVVVTGGEPMIAPEIGPLTRELKALGQHITIETAGTVFAGVDCDLMSISPKLANSTPWEREGGRWANQHERLRVQPDVLRRLMRAFAYQLKFVVREPADMAELTALVRELGAEASRVVLMPEGKEPGVLRERGQWLAEICKREGFRFTPRLHVELYGNRRGT